jgi:hypothetical protein
MKSHQRATTDNPRAARSRSERQLPARSNGVQSIALLTGKSSGAILADLRRRVREIYDLNAVGSVLTWDQATYMPNSGAVGVGDQATGDLTVNAEENLHSALGILGGRVGAGGGSTWARLFLLG